jgi:hypothetical protein
MSTRFPRVFPLFAMVLALPVCAAVRAAEEAPDKHAEITVRFSSPPRIFITHADDTGYGTVSLDATQPPAATFLIP